MGFYTNFIATHAIFPKNISSAFTKFDRYTMHGVIDFKQPSWLKTLANGQTLRIAMANFDSAKAQWFERQFDLTLELQFGPIQSSKYN